MGMQAGAARATSHRLALPWAYLTRVSASTISAAANTIQANGPPMIRATTPRTEDDDLRDLDEDVPALRQRVAELLPPVLVVVAGVRGGM